MVRLAGRTAFVAGGACGIGRGIARSLASAGVKVALAGADRPSTEAVARRLSAAGGTAAAVPLDASDAASWSAAAGLAEALLGEISIVVDATATEQPLERGPFVLCRWTQALDPAVGRLAAETFASRFATRGTEARVLTARPISGLMAMALLVPGSLSTRIVCSPGVAAARLFGPDRDRRIAQDDRRRLAVHAEPDEVGALAVDAFVSEHSVIATRAEWALAAGAPAWAAPAELVVA